MGKRTTRWVCRRGETLALGNCHPAPGNAKRRHANRIGRSNISEQENLVPLEQEAHSKSNDIGRRSECGRGVQSFEVGAADCTTSVCSHCRRLLLRSIIRCAVR
jgi:hypothetical protein